MFFSTDGNESKALQGKELVRSWEENKLEKKSTVKPKTAQKLLLCHYVTKIRLLVIKGLSMFATFPITWTQAR